MAKRTRKGGYLSWNPMNWFKAAPETVPEATQPATTEVPEPITTAPDTTSSSTPETTSKFNFGSTPTTGARRKTRRGGRRHGSKKTRSGKTSNRR